MKYADLHIHTIYSDGTFTPKEAVEAAKRNGLSCISITDHDTVEEIDLVQEEALRNNIENIPGIELTSDENSTEFHILGYFINYKDKDFLKLLGNIAVARIERVHAMVEKLNKHKINISAEDVFSLAEKGTVGRLHVARAMRKKGYIASTNEAFQKYIGSDGPCYVASFKLTPEQAIKSILKVGGIPVLAHPLDLGDDTWIPRLVKYGLRGLEVFYLEYSGFVRDKYLKIAKEFNLVVTGGSDCHGLAKEQVRMGKIKIPYSLIEKLKDAREKL